MPQAVRRRRAGIGRTRFFLRYARSIAPWLHPPGWLFDILINAFLDQARMRLARLLQAAVQALRTLIDALQDTGACTELCCTRMRELDTFGCAALCNRAGSQYYVSKRRALHWCR
jgi:hypothetical protein